MELLKGGGITTIVRNVQICLDEETLGIILGVPMVGVRTIKGCKPTASQAAFIPDKNNVLISHELVKGYGRKGISPRCVFKIDRHMIL
ncbi:hypothetical protein H5410_026613 [Solanum commersonii]|uniref:Uncharacterized protein n=1 Tax=Solanum commersonii TaxID=4109 RepID=A0A9J5YX15_SOLCO|nr:hypothetical protein H5410_026613 [Solanum commersonii]